MNWIGCRSILIIRPDNMGDLIMSSPAIKALKQTFNCKITALTSELAAEAASLIPEIDETIAVSVPWVKTDKTLDPEELIQLAENLKSRNFDACVIFTVYSQNPLPAAMLAWMAKISKRLAYCRENPYDLINNWIPDQEPYSYILHQVQRDLNLVKHVGATVDNEDITLSIPNESFDFVKGKLNQIIPDQPDYIIFHAGVSELKRAYPIDMWIELAKRIHIESGFPILFTGSAQEKQLTNKLQEETGEVGHSVAGVFNIAQLAALISMSRLLVSVNTGPVHIAAGLKTPVIVLYAQTNPQHTPWKSNSRIFEFSVNSSIRSKNEVICYVNRTIYKHRLPYPEVSEIALSAHSLLSRDLVP